MSSTSQKEGFQVSAKNIYQPDPRQNITVLYSSSSGKIVLPHDFAAMMSLSEGTKWPNYADEDGQEHPDSIEMFKEDFEKTSGRRPLIVYIFPYKGQIRKIIYGFGSILDFEDESTYQLDWESPEMACVDMLYEEALTSAPKSAPYLKACAHHLHIEKFNDNFKKIIDISEKTSSDEEEEINLIGKKVIRKLDNQDYLPGYMFGMIDQTFGDSRLQKHLPFLLEADKKGYAPLRFIDSSYMDEKTYSDIALMLIAQDASNLQNAQPSIFRNIDFIKKLLEISNSEQPAVKRAIMRHLHRIPALYGKISGDFVEMLGHIQKQYPDKEHKQLGFERRDLP